MMYYLYNYWRIRKKKESHHSFIVYVFRYVDLVLSYGADLKSIQEIFLSYREGTLPIAWNLPPIGTAYLRVLTQYSAMRYSAMCSGTGVNESSAQLPVKIAHLYCQPYFDS